MTDIFSFLQIQLYFNLGRYHTSFKKSDVQKYTVICSQVGKWQHLKS